MEIDKPRTYDNWLWWKRLTTLLKEISGKFKRYETDKQTEGI